MRREFFGAALVIGLLTGGGQALAAGETTDLHVPPQTRTDVREWVVKNKPKAYRFTDRVVVGTTVPPDVTIGAVPEPWGPELRSYHYYVYGEDDRVILVEPSGRRVVHIID